jgi:ankyrin repeat protein
MHAAEKKDLATLLVLLQTGANPNARNHMGWTAIMMAVSTGDEKIVEALVDNGADVNVISHNRQTPLYIADANGFNNISRFLITAGAKKLPFRIPKGELEKKR